MDSHNQQPSLTDQIAAALEQAVIEQSIPGYETSGIAQAFFRVWMKDRGHAFYFLFRKNLRITNIQFGELLALASRHVTNRLTSAAPFSLQFVSSADFVATIGGLLNTFPMSADPPAMARKLALLYAPLLENTIVVDALYGSCSMYLPPHLDLDLAAVCGLSGYIHSCGRNVFLRNVAKATPDHFFEALQRHLRCYPRGDKRIFFTVYAHEDFTNFDSELRRELVDGLDDVKIYVEKFFMGHTHLVDVLKQLRTRFHDEFAVPDPGDFRKVHERLRRESDVDQTRTMWLIADSNVTPDGQRGEDRYFICYDQLYDNKNPFQVFDENKPGWYEHTTIPHSLMAAMINITSPGWRESSVVVADPFCGTGTMWLEAVKHHELEAHGSDLSPLAVKAATDNALFFALDDLAVGEIGRLIELVGGELEGHPSARRDSTETGVSDRTRARRLADRVRKWAADPSYLGADRARRVLDEEHDLVSRIVFYLVLRTYKRHAPGLERGAEEWGRAFAREAATLAWQMSMLAELKGRADRGTERADGLVECPGSYSLSVTISPKRLRRPVEAGFVGLTSGDARNISECAVQFGGYNVIVTDPPYGFNTDEGPEQLASLYAEMLAGAIRALRPGGQLVVCLPERSNIGKVPVPFAQRNIITHQVLSLSFELGRNMVAPLRSNPGPASIFGPPFYWSSDRALRRAIVQFHFA